MLLRSAFIPVLFLATCFGHDGAKPACNTQTRGDLWPSARTNNPCVAVEMCTLHIWKYRWEKITMPVGLLAKKEKPACDAGAGPGRDATPPNTKPAPQQTQARSDSPEHSEQ